MDWNSMLNFLAAILAIVNPIGLIPIWYEMTGDAQSQVRKKIAFMVTGSAFVILLLFLNVGNWILDFFRIDIEVFKIAGGFLLLLTAVAMVQGKATKLDEKSEKRSEERRVGKESKYRWAT